MNPLENKRRTTIILTIIITAAIIISAVAYVGFFMQEPTPEKEEEPEQEIDDRISPLENQGLILEIKRIRHRGLLDEIMSRGTSWRQKPSFYYVTDIDGLVYESKYAAGASGEAEQLFTTWDTLLQDNRVLKDVEEENESSDITLTIKERVTKGIFGMRTEDVEKEKFHVTYDFRTGRWEGDDSLRDQDGYGHYVGENYEIWFEVYQTDFDHDYIPYWTEVNVLHTDPREDDSQKDPDNDGIPTTWEWKWGYDPHTWNDHRNLDPDIDGLSNVEEYQMAEWFADPFTQDMYIEVDGMERGGPFDPPHVYWKESGQVMMERFCDHGINVYIDNGWPNGPSNGGGESLTHYEVLSPDSGMMLEYYKHHFADERKGVFRYVIISHSAGWIWPSEFNMYDTSAIATSRKQLYTYKTAFTPRTQRLSLAALLLHEIGGHSNGITRWTFEGCDNMTYTDGIKARQHYKETWGDYYSVMNYYHIYDYSLVDLSDGSNGPPYDQNDWIHLYLPTFQIENTGIEQPFFEAPGYEHVVAENTTPELDGWKYNENLTSQGTLIQRYQQNIASSDAFSNGFEWRVYVKTEDNGTNENNIRVYAKPKVSPTYSLWALVWEGNTNEEGDLQFYSCEDAVDEVMQKIE